MERGDQPVSRKKCAVGKTVKEKYIDDIWRLMCSIKNSKCVERVLLKNGKRSGGELEKARKLAVAQNSPESVSISRAYAVSSLTASSDQPANTLPSTRNLSDSSAFLPSMKTTAVSSPAARICPSVSSNKPSISSGGASRFASSPPAPSSSVCHPCQPPSSPVLSSLAPPPLPLSTSLDDRFFHSSVVAEIQKIRQDLISVKSDL